MVSLEYETMKVTQIWVAINTKDEIGDYIRDCNFKEWYIYNYLGNEYTSYIGIDTGIHIWWPQEISKMYMNLYSLDDML